MDIREIALEFCGRGGKRLRPRLCKAAFERCGGTGDIGGVCDAIECFHKASLIHDDIQDGDEERYGRPTVWKEHGVPVAIAAGDWLVAHGYRLITKVTTCSTPQHLNISTHPLTYRFANGRPARRSPSRRSWGRWRRVRTTRRSAGTAWRTACCSRSTTT